MGGQSSMRLLTHFHRNVPADSLCLYRAFLGGVLTAEALSWLPHTTELFSNVGYHIPNVIGTPAPPPWLALFLGLSLMISALGVAVGFLTRASIALTLVLWSYIYCLDSLNEKTAQTITIIALVILFFTPCGARYSVDDFLRRRRGQQRESAELSVFTQRLLQIEFAQIYFFSGIAKMMNPEWVSGAVFYRVLNGRLATPIGVAISSLDSDLLSRAGGLGTILFELSQGFLLFLPLTRAFAIVNGLFFHAGIQSTLYIGTLGAHFILALLLLFPEPESVARAAGWLLPMVKKKLKLKA